MLCLNRKSKAFVFSLSTIFYTFAVYIPASIYPMPPFAVNIDQFKAGDRKVFDSIYRYYSRPLQHFAFSYVKDRNVAEEVVSDTMLKLWNNRESIKNPSQIKAFLYIATKNACIDSVRASRVLPMETLPTEADDLMGEAPEVYNRILYTELLQQIELAINQLPPSQQVVFRMSFLEGKTTEEIAKETGMTVPSIFSQKSKAIAVLRKLLSGNLLFLLWLAGRG